MTSMSAACDDVIKTCARRTGRDTQAYRTAQRNFVESMAGYSILSYLFQACAAVRTAWVRSMHLTSSTHTLHGSECTRLRLPRTSNGRSHRGSPHRQRLSFAAVQPEAVPPADAKPEWAQLCGCIVHISPTRRSTTPPARRTAATRR
jgi:hypothetical protein